MQRRASSTYGPTNAPVGHWSRHLEHFPQPARCFFGSSGASLTVVSISPRKKPLPNLRPISRLFFPVNPSLPPM
eukprot:891200-Rhodomonas_salina.3